MPVFRAISTVFFYLVVAAAISLAFVAANAAEAQATPEQLRTINKYAKEYNLDARLLVAIAGVESGYNEKAVGALGEVGLFQVRPEFHKGANLHKLNGNVRVAAGYLAYLRGRCRATRGAAWFTCYNTGENRSLKNPKATQYYKRVQTLYVQQLNKPTTTPY